MAKNIQAAVSKYLPLIEANEAFLRLSSQLTERIQKTNNVSESMACLFFTRAATLFDAAQILCRNLKSIEGLILLRSLYEIVAYLNFIWIGKQLSEDEMNKRASYYLAWEHKEEKKLLNVFRNSPGCFWGDMKKTIPAKADTIEKHYKQVLEIYPELEKRKHWYGSSLEELAKEIDLALGRTDMQAWYNSIVRAQNWAVHTGPKSAKENSNYSDDNIHFQYGGNDTQMLNVLLQSYLLYKAFVLRVGEMFGMNLKENIIKFEMDIHEPALNEVEKRLNLDGASPP